ncbi:MAG: agmatine deiminase family protein [Prevotellaceae bacterium]|nr:agmatine deiminase family protein [Prevotellaceae bacterium]
MITALERHGVNYRFLNNTNDIWCRDYMPVQVAKDVFCGYTYDSDYLHDTEELLATRTDGNQVCSEHGFKVKVPEKPLVIDGGNVIRCGEDKIIMIEKIFSENNYEKGKLTKIIEEHFMAELIVLPWDTYELFGHADGLVRYIGNDSVLITNYDKYDKYFTREVVDILKRHFKNVEKLEYHVKRQHKHNWAYINWLQTDKALFIPAFGYDEDEQAFEQITSLMPMYRGHAEMIDARDLIRHEGCLNCASWTIQS